MRAWTLIALVFIAAAAPTESPAASGDEIVVRARRILTMDGAEIRDGVIVIANGKIRKVGASAEIPKGARVVDAAVVMPGIVVASSRAGLSRLDSEESREITPELRVLDEVDLRSGDFERARAQGITTVQLTPSDRAVVGGLCSVLKTAGDTVAGSVVSEDIALKATMGSMPARGNFPPRGGPPSSHFARRPTTRMGVVWEFRKAFFDAKSYRESPPDERSRPLEILGQALDGKLRLLVTASTAVDIETALRLTDEYGLKFVLEEAQESWKRAELLAKRRIPVLLRPSFSPRWIHDREGSEIRYTTFTTLLQAGVTTALLPAGDDESEGPLATAALAVKHGATSEQALAALTRVPADILGIAGRVGAIAEGRDADLLLLSGDPLDVTTRIERVFIDGRLATGAWPE